MKYELIDRTGDAPVVENDVLEAADGNVLLAKLLSARGISTGEEAKAFLNPDAAQLLDPFGFHDMQKAVDLIKKAITDKRHICIHGDYDADGTSGAAILACALRSMGADPQVIIPDRNGSGYGLSEEALLSVPDGSLLITVDCGIRNVAEVDLAHEHGMDVIISDHHACPDELPAAECIINPKKPGETYGNPNLCGAGVALKMVHALLGSEEALEYVDLAALATIADVVPLLGENRAIAALGIHKMNKNPRAGIAALKSMCHSSDTVTSSVVAFEMVPIINAAGRMLTANMAYQLLTASRPADGKRGIADVLAATLADQNRIRKEAQASVVKEAEEMLEQDSGFPRFIVVAGKDWPLGVTGPAASRLAEKYRRPTVVLAWNGEAYVGSARTAGNLNLYDALLSAAHLMDKFGGHREAAGLTIREENLGALSAELDAYMVRSEMGRIPEYSSLRTCEYDFEPALPIDLTTIETLKRLEPCGCANPHPMALFRHAQIRNARPLGKSGAHASFDIAQDGGSIRGVMFGTSASDAPPLGDVVGELQVSDFGPRRGQVEMVVRVLSAENREEAYLRKAVEALRRPGPPSNTKLFFRDKARMREIYSAFRTCTRGGGITTLHSLYAASSQRLKDLTREEAAFAYAVFSELGLIEDVADGKIKIVTNAKKTALDKSEIYRKCER